MHIAFPKAAKKLLRAPFAVSLCILTPQRSQQYTMSPRVRSGFHRPQFPHVFDVPGSPVLPIMCRPAYLVDAHCRRQSNL